MSKAARGKDDPGAYRVLGRAVSAFLLVAVWLAVAPPLARAAEIGLSDKPGCLLELNGYIVEGDVERFGRLAAQYWTRSPYEQADNAEIALCLNSPGGSFQVGHEISVLVHELSMATRVGPGAVCLSACSLVFMAGRVSGTEIDDKRRILHVNGKLGFHAPFTDLDDTLQLTGKDVNEFVPDFTGMIADFIRHSSFRNFTQHQPSISLGLLAEMFAMSQNDMFMIDTVERAARWGVELDGVGAPPRFTLTQYLQLCDNQLAWLYDSASQRVDPNLHSSQGFQTVRKPMQPAAKDFVVLERGGLASRLCEIEVMDVAETGTGLCLSDGFTGLGLGDCNDPSMPYSVWFPWWHAMPPNMPLAALQ